MRRLLFALPLLASCYRYTPLVPTGGEPGSGVRLRISAAFAEQIQSLLGTTDARVIAGRLIEAGADTLIVEVPTVVRADIGNATQTLNQRVSIPRSAVIEMETRTLDRSRTYALAGAASVALGVFVIRALTKDPGLEGSRGGGPTDIRLP